jgi:hypothetical protein
VLLQRERETKQTAETMRRTEIEKEKFAPKRTGMIWLDERWPQQQRSHRKGISSKLGLKQRKNK